MAVSWVADRTWTAGQLADSLVDMNVVCSARITWHVMCTVARPILVAGGGRHGHRGSMVCRSVSVR